MLIVEPTPEGVSAFIEYNSSLFDTATREIDTALTLAPYVSDALVFRADLEARRGDMSSARNDLHEALRFNPRHRGALGRLQVMQ